MIRHDIVDAVVAKTGISQVKSAQVLDVVLNTIKSALIQGWRIEIRRFGALKVKTYKARPGHNPKSGASVVVPKRKKIKFKVSKKF